jgi:hypothetical protein
MWGALSDERTGLSFTIAAGPRQRSHSRVRVSWDSGPYFTVSDSRLPFSSPPTTRSVNGGGIRPRLHTGEIYDSSQSYVTTDGQPASLSWNKAPIWGLQPDLDCCLTVAGLLIWVSRYISSGRNDRKHLSFPYPRKCLLTNRTVYPRKRRLVTDWFPRIHFHGNVFAYPFPSNGSHVTICQNVNDRICTSRRINMFEILVVVRIRKVKCCVLCFMILPGNNNDIQEGRQAVVRSYCRWDGMSWEAFRWSVCTQLLTPSWINIRRHYLVVLVFVS